MGKKRLHLANRVIIGVTVVVILVFLPLILLFGISAIQADYAFYGTKLSSAQGTVVASDSQVFINPGGGAMTGCTNTVLFTPAGQSASYMVTDHGCSDGTSAQGKQVEVLYDPNDPSRAKTANQASGDIASAYTGTILGVVALPLAVIGIAGATSASIDKHRNMRLSKKKRQRRSQTSKPRYPRKNEIEISISPMVAPPALASLLHGRYKLLREIGQGGFGVVYLAEDHKDNRRLVAVKQINIGKLRPQESIEATAAYNREVSLLSKLRHSRLPLILDHFTDPEHWYVVMDYIKGQTLEAYVQARSGQGLPLGKVIKIGLQLCEVLNYLHNQTPPIIFRDVKPSNILLRSRGEISLIDFGIARRFVPAQSRDTSPLGSPGYAAPEQYGTSQTTPRTDIYALGATLQTLVTGKDPLELLAEEASLSGTTWLHREFADLLSQMLEKESSKRPESIQDVSASLFRLERRRRMLEFPF